MHLITNSTPSKVLLVWPLLRILNKRSNRRILNFWANSKTLIIAFMHFKQIIFYEFSLFIALTFQGKIIITGL